MQIKYPIDKELSEETLNVILPTGYSSELACRNLIIVVRDSDRRRVGECEQCGFAAIVRFDNSEEGNAFVSAFGMKHPKFNPKQTLYGFVYESPETGLFQLDTTPWSLRVEAMDKIKHYVATGSIYFVTFFLGNWTSEMLEVNSMRRILFTGELDEENMGPNRLNLGNIENDRTM